MASKEPTRDQVGGEHDPYCDLSRGLGGCNCLPDFGAPERVWMVDEAIRIVGMAQQYLDHPMDQQGCVLVLEWLAAKEDAPSERFVVNVLRDLMEESGGQFSEQFLTTYARVILAHFQRTGAERAGGDEHVSFGAVMGQFKRTAGKDAVLVEPPASVEAPSEEKP